MGEEQVWTADGWSSRFGLDLPDDSTGYAHTPDDVSKVSGPDSDLYLGYIDAVCDRSINYVGELSDSDFDDIVDERFTPAGHARGAAVQRDQRRPAACRPGGDSSRNPRAEGLTRAMVARTDELVT